MPRSPTLNCLFRLVFYGHIWIALGAAGLSWRTSHLAAGERPPDAVHGFIFCATLAVYTFHRYLSFRRAGVVPESHRYAIVSAYPRATLFVGFLAIAGAGSFALSLPPASLLPVLTALPFTVFYLVPLYPGGPRLRDFPYLKALWVGIAWAVITVIVPLGYFSVPEFASRLAFTASLALIFDYRDTELDRSQGVKTVAAQHPVAGKAIALFLLFTAALIDQSPAYLLAVPVYLLATPGRSEHFYDVWGNGVLLLPPLWLWLFGQ